MRRGRGGHRGRGRAFQSPPPPHMELDDDAGVGDSAAVFLSAEVRETSLPLLKAVLGEHRTDDYLLGLLLAADGDAERAINFHLGGNRPADPLVIDTDDADRMFDFDVSEMRGITADDEHPGLPPDGPPDGTAKDDLLMIGPSRVPLTCGITYQRISGLPMRGSNCTHHRCFSQSSIEEFRSHAERNRRAVTCPICGSVLKRVVVHTTLQAMLKVLPEEVMDIDQSANGFTAHLDDGRAWKFDLNGRVLSQPASPPAAQSSPPAPRPPSVPIEISSSSSESDGPMQPPSSTNTRKASGGPESPGTSDEHRNGEPRPVPERPVPRPARRKVRASPLIGHAYRMGLGSPQASGGGLRAAGSTVASQGRSPIGPATVNGKRRRSTDIGTIERNVERRISEPAVGVGEDLSQLSATSPETPSPLFANAQSPRVAPSNPSAPAARTLARGATDEDLARRLHKGFNAHFDPMSVDDGGLAGQDALPSRVSGTESAAAGGGSSLPNARLSLGLPSSASGPLSPLRAAFRYGASLLTGKHKNKEKEKEKEDEEMEAPAAPAAPIDAVPSDDDASGWIDNPMPRVIPASVQSGLPAVRMRSHNERWYFGRFKRGFNAKCTSNYHLISLARDPNPFKDKNLADTERILFERFRELDFLERNNYVKVSFSYKGPSSAALQADVEIVRENKEAREAGNQLFRPHNTGRPRNLHFSVYAKPSLFDELASIISDLATRDIPVHKAEVDAVNWPPPGLTALSRRAPNRAAMDARLDLFDLADRSGIFQTEPDESAYVPDVYDSFGTKLDARWMTSKKPIDGVTPFPADVSLREKKGGSKSAELLLRRLESPRYRADLTPKDRFRGLNVTLFPYQADVVQWMLDRERGPPLGAIFWQRGRFRPSPGAPSVTPAQFYYNPSSTHVRLTPPTDDMLGSRGGILAEEMGMGKTVELLALIVARPCTLPRYRVTRNDRVVWASNHTRKWTKKFSVLLANGTREERTQQLGWLEQLRDSVDGKYLPEQAALRNVPLGHLRSNATLIVCPVSLLGQWENEIRARTPKLKLLMFHGDRRAKSTVDLCSQLEDQGIDVILTSNGIAERSKDVLWPITWWRVIVDECQTIKNSSSNQSQAVNWLEAHQRWAVSGTPIGGSLQDLSGLFTFLRLEQLPWSHLEAYMTTSLGHPVSPGVYAMEAWWVYRILRYVMMRHTKEQTFMEKPIIALPARTMHTRLISLTRSEQIIYAFVSQESRRSFQNLESGNRLNKEYLRTMSLLLHLRQAAVRASMYHFRSEEEEAVYQARFGDHLAIPRHVHRQPPPAAGPAIGADDSDAGIRHAMDTLMEQLERDGAPAFARELAEALRSGDPGQCAICFDASDVPVVLPCLHSFCKECVLEYVNRSGNTCPNCRKPFTADKLTEVRIKFLLDPVPEPDANGDDTEAREDDESLTPLQRAQRAQRRMARKRGSRVKALMEELTTMIQASDDNKAVVFTQYIELLEAVGQTLTRQNIGFATIRGNMTQKKRAQMLNRFAQDRSCKVFLLSIRSGGAGLTLTSANHVFVLDAPLNAALTEQAVSRTHRIGQRRPVTVVQFAGKGTVEERIIKGVGKLRDYSAAPAGQGATATSATTTTTTTTTTTYAPMPVDETGVGSSSRGPGAAAAAGSSSGAGAGSSSGLAEAPHLATNFGRGDGAGDQHKALKIDDLKQLFGLGDAKDIEMPEFRASLEATQPEPGRRARAAAEPADILSQLSQNAPDERAVVDAMGAPTQDEDLDDFMTQAQSRQEAKGEGPGLVGS